MVSHYEPFNLPNLLDEVNDDVLLELNLLYRNLLCRYFYWPCIMLNLELVQFYNKEKRGCGLDFLSLPIIVVVIVVDIKRLRLWW